MAKAKQCKFLSLLPAKVQYEIKSALTTFIAIFVGTLLASPAINALLDTALPTIQQFQDIVPVFVDTVFRSLWVTVLARLGLSHRKKA